MAGACFQLAKPAQVGWLNMAAVRSGDKYIKRREFCRCRGQV